ncbi:hypothetical protein [Paraburkholderia sp. BR14312]
MNIDRWISIAEALCGIAVIVAAQLQAHAPVTTIAGAAVVALAIWHAVRDRNAD